MNRYLVLVSTNARRNPVTVPVQACDGAEAAFAAWCKCGLPDFPEVRCLPEGRYRFNSDALLTVMERAA